MRVKENHHARAGTGNPRYGLAISRGIREYRGREETAGRYDGAPNLGRAESPLIGTYSRERRNCHGAVVTEKGGEAYAKERMGGKEREREEPVDANSGSR